MAERLNKAFRTVDSAKVQGDGSFVKLRAPRLSDVMDAQEQLGAKAAETALGLAVIKRCIVAWDWVDDNGDPLPDPAEHPEVIDELPLPEAVFLVESLDLGALADTKN